MKIAVVTDSTSDIPPEVAAENGIHVVPNLLTIENVSYQDGAGISREDFYENISHYSQPPTTAAPSPEVYRQVYQQLFDSGIDLILSFHPSAKLSALVSVVTQGAESFGDKVIIIDSNSASLGLGFQVIYAARAVARGVDPSEILSQAEQLKDKIRVYALLDTLSHVRSGGRVHWVTSSLADMLGLRAIIELRDGTVHRQGLTRTRTHALQLLKKVVEKAGEFQEAALLFTTPLVKEESNLLLCDFPTLSSPKMVVPITPIIGTHVGPRCIGIALVLE